MRTVLARLFRRGFGFRPKESNALLFQTFEKDASGWTAMGDAAEVRTTADAARVARRTRRAGVQLRDRSPAVAARAGRPRVHWRHAEPAVLGAQRSQHPWESCSAKRAAGAITRRGFGRRQHLAAIELTPRISPLQNGRTIPWTRTESWISTRWTASRSFDLARYFSQWTANPRLP